MAEQWQSAKGDVERYTGLAQEGAKKQSAIKEAGAKQIGEIQSQAPADPKLEAIPDKFEYKPIDAKELESSVSTMMAFAAIGGLMTRQPMTAALNAFGKGIEGLVKGDQISFDREYRTFKTNMDQAIAKNNEAVTKYRLAFDKHKGNLQAALDQIKLDADGAKDTVTSALAGAQNAKGVMQHLESLIKSQQQNEAVLKRLDFQIQESRRQAAEAAARDATANRRIDVMERQGDARIAAAAAKGTQGKVLPAAAAEDISGRVTVIDAIDSLIKRQEEAIKKGAGFGGYGFDMAGNVIMKGKRATGSGNQDEVNFFSDLENVAQPDRHAMFGATLTGNEKDAYRTGWVGAGDDPQVLLNVLKSKRDLYQQMMRSKLETYGRMGYNVGGLLGEGAPAPAPAGGGGVPAPAAKAPALNEERVINGTPAVWDGKGWLPK